MNYLIFDFYVVGGWAGEARSGKLG